MEADNFWFWELAYRNNAPALLGVLRRYVRDSSVIYDLLHEVFITAIDKYDSYAGKGAFEAWLYRIAVNTALTYLRNERREQAVMDLETQHDLSSDEDEADDRQIDNAKAAIEAAEFTDIELLAAIDRLPEHHKLVFNMYVMDDFSHKQIAAKLNISSGTSKSHLARARKKLQQLLYEDAMNRINKRDRRRASVFLALFPGKEHYIDKLYRNGLSDFTIPPTGGSGFLAPALEHHIASTASVATQTAMSTTAFWGGKLSYIAACCGTAVITGTVCWLSMSDNSPLNRDGGRMNMNNDNIITVSDTLTYSPIPIDTDDTVSVEPDYFLNNSNGESSEETVTAPVIVKKQIIQHQTVVIRDTIFIAE